MTDKFLVTAAAYKAVEQAIGRLDGRMARMELTREKRVKKMRDQMAPLENRRVELAETLAKMQIAADV